MPCDNRQPIRYLPRCDNDAILSLLPVQVWYSCRVTTNSGSATCPGVIMMQYCLCYLSRCDIHAVWQQTADLLPAVAPRTWHSQAAALSAPICARWRRRLWSHSRWSLRQPYCQSFGQFMLNLLLPLTCKNTWQFKTSNKKNCKVDCGYITQLHTHTRLTALFPGLPGWAGTRMPDALSAAQPTVSLHN